MRQPAGAFKLYQEMIERGITPNVTTYEELVGKSRSSYLRRNGPGMSFFAMILTIHRAVACIMAGDVDGAVEIINNLPPGMNPTYRMFATVVRPSVRLYFCLSDRPSVRLSFPLLFIFGCELSRHLGSQMRPAWQPPEGISRSN
jgi:hypothetical protein